MQKEGSVCSHLSPLSCPNSDRGGLMLCTRSKGQCVSTTLTLGAKMTFGLLTCILARLAALPPQRHAHPRGAAAPNHRRDSPSVAQFARSRDRNQRAIIRNRFFPDVPNLQQILPRLSEKESCSVRNRCMHTTERSAQRPPRKGQIDQSRPRLVRHSGSAACNRSLGTAAQPRVTVVLAPRLSRE